VPLLPADEALRLVDRHFKETARDRQFFIAYGGPTPLPQRVHAEIFAVALVWLTILA
jgi:hypothetical protein